MTLTIDLWRSMFFQWIEYHPINILHKFQIDISSNSREIKYQNIGRTHTQTHTQTDRQTDRAKTIPRNPLRGRGNNALVWLNRDVSSLTLTAFVNYIRIIIFSPHCSSLTIDRHSFIYVVFYHYIYNKVTDMCLINVRLFVNVWYPPFILLLLLLFLFSLLYTTN